MARPGFAGAPRLIRLTSPSAHTTLRDAMLPGGSAHSQLHRVRKHRRLLLRRVSASFSCCHLLLQPPQPPPDRPEFQAVEWMVRWSSRATSGTPWALGAMGWWRPNAIYYQGSGNVPTEVQVEANTTSVSV